MKEKYIIVLIIISLTLACSKPYKPLLDLEGKKIRGKIFYREDESKEIMIGQTVSEFDNLMNTVMTDTTGIFEIQFHGSHPVIVLSGFYQPIYVKIYPEHFNTIIIDKRLEKKSVNLLKKINTIKEN